MIHISSCEGIDRALEQCLYQSYTELMFIRHKIVSPMFLCLVQSPVKAARLAYGCCRAYLS